jgi:tRNA(fMet)-specific endonuclease VapC
LIYLLDTNVCIRLLNNTSPTVTARLAAQQPENIYLSTVVQMELVYGAYRSANSEEQIEIVSRVKDKLAGIRKAETRRSNQRRVAAPGSRTRDG